MAKPGLFMKYFVLSPTSRDVWHAEATREAMRTYARMVTPTEPELAAEIDAWLIDLEVSDPLYKKLPPTAGGE